MNLSGFDLAVGDLVSGQLPLEEIPLFLGQVRSLLDERGVFVTKSFFQRESRPTYDELVQHCSEQANSFGDIFPKIVYLLAAYSVGEDDVLRFEKMLKVVDEVFLAGALRPDQHQRMHEFGWNTSFKVHFTMPTAKHWEELLGNHFVSFDTVTSPHLHWSVDLPTYVARTSQI